MIARFVNAWIPEHQQHAFGIAVDELNLCFENRDASAFTADERAGQVEAPVFSRQQLVEVVPGNASWNAWIFFLDEIRITITQFAKLSADLPCAAALGNLLVKLPIIRLLSSRHRLHFSKGQRRSISCMICSAHRMASCMALIEAGTRVPLSY
jgi:hypothetical protein